MILRSLIIWLLLTAAAGAQVAQTGAGLGTTIPPYTGPGDVVSGASAWYGLRGYTSAYAAPGTNKAIKIQRRGLSDQASCDFVVAPSGALGTTTAGCSAGGGLTYQQFLLHGSCTATIASTTLSCTSATTTPGSGDSWEGVGIINTLFNPGNCSAFVAGAGTCTVSAYNQPIPTISSPESMNFYYQASIPKFYDQTGNGFDMVNTGGPEDPWFAVSCYNGTPCVWGTVFSYPVLQSTGGPFRAQPYSLVWDGSMFNPLGHINAIFGSGSDAMGAGYDATSNKAWMSGGLNVTATATWLNQNVIVNVFNGASSVLSVNNTNSTVNAGTAALSVTNFLYSLDAGGTLQSAIANHEFGIWPSALSAGNITSLCHNMFVAWGTAVSC